MVQTFTLAEGQTYSIQYRDAIGNLSARTIRVMESNNGFVRAFCFNAMEPRTFRTDRLSSPALISNEVGEAMYTRALSLIPRDYTFIKTARIPGVWRNAVTV